MSAVKQRRSIAMMVIYVFFLGCLSCKKDLPQSEDGLKDIDGNLYPTVVIEHQEWMAENLKVTRYNDGTPIEYIADDSQWAISDKGAFAWYDHDAFENKEKYGALYNGFAVMSGKLCPARWRIPSNLEWGHLVNNISGGLGPGGNLLKSCRQVHSPLGGACDTGEHPRWDNDPVQFGTDEFGFSALPGGYRNLSGQFMLKGNQTWWWSSDTFSYSPSYEENQDADPQLIFLVRGIISSEQRVIPSTAFVEYGLSVRCVKAEDGN